MSLAVGLGNAVDVTSGGRAAHYLAADETTRAVDAARRVGRGRPGTDRGSPRADRPQSRSPRSWSAAATSPTSPARTPAPWQRHGARRAPRSGTRAPFSWMTNGQLVDAVTALSAVRLRTTRRPRRRRGHRPGRTRASARRRPARAGHRCPAAIAATPWQALGGLLPPLTYQANPVDTGRPGETFGAGAALRWQPTRRSMLVSVVHAERAGSTRPSRSPVGGAHGRPRGAGDLAVRAEEIRPARVLAAASSASRSLTSPGSPHCRAYAPSLHDARARARLAHAGSPERHAAADLVAPDGPPGRGTRQRRSWTIARGPTPSRRACAQPR